MRSAQVASHGSDCCSGGEAMWPDAENCLVRDVVVARQSCRACLTGERAHLFRVRGTRLFWRWLLVAGLGLTSLSSCGPMLDDMGAGAPGPGKVCYDDSECVPNDCCGLGTGVVHISDAPSCSNVSCSSGCDSRYTDCGCGLPVCRNSRCAVAVSTDDRCQP